jgi:hypothetical protein
VCVCVYTWPVHVTSFVGGGLFFLVRLRDEMSAARPCSSSSVVFFLPPTPGYVSSVFGMYFKAAADKCGADVLCHYFER